MERWRLLPFMRASGTTQMAIDQWLLDRHYRDNHPPTLRFYTWSPAAISLGYHQHRYPDFWQQLTWQGEPLQLIRRPSGGRAVLHQGDLTYAVITSMSGSRLQTYQAICEFLIQGWNAIGVALHYGESGRGYVHQANCFGTSTVADLVVADGAKLIGSAQLRRGNAILQHGSMRLEPNQALHDRVFGSDSLQAPNLPLSLSGDALIETVIAALTQAAIDCFQIQLEPEPLAEHEWQAIQTGLAANEQP